MGRRRFVTVAAAASEAYLLDKPALAASKSNRITEENSKPGTLEWQLRYHSFDDPVTMASYPLNRLLRHSAIEGYASKASVLPGESIDFLISMKPAGSFLVDIYRMGYSRGARAPPI